MSFPLASLAMAFHFSLSVVPTAPALANLPAEPRPGAAPCSGGAFETLAFWIGEWDVQWRRSDGTTGTGTSKVTRELGGCVIRERFDDPGSSFSGISQSSLNPFSQQWNMAWADNKGQPFLAKGAARGEANSDYVLNLESGGGPLFRISFQDVQPDAFTWRFQMAAKPNSDWVDLTVSKYHCKR